MMVVRNVASIAPQLAFQHRRTDRRNSPAQDVVFGTHILGYRQQISLEQCLCQEGHNHRCQKEHHLAQIGLPVGQPGGREGKVRAGRQGCDRGIQPHGWSWQGTCTPPSQLAKHQVGAPL